MAFQTVVEQQVTLYIGELGQVSNSVAFLGKLLNCGEQNFRVVKMS